MPQVTITSSKGLVQTSGSGFTVSDVELVRSNESITPTGGVYTVTCEGSDGTSLDQKYFVIYDQVGESYGMWIDASGTTTVPSGASAVAGDVDNELEIVGITGVRTATQVAALLASEINGAAAFLTEFFAKSSAETLTIYVLDTGEMTTDTEDPGDTGFAVSLADGSDGDLDEDVESTLITIGNDVEDVADQSVQLADGSSVGQRKNVMFAASSNTGCTIDVGGNFIDSALLLSSQATKTGLATLVWNGSAWVAQTLINTTVA